MKIELKQSFRIEAARHLPKLPSTHPCSRMHGHGFEITFILQGEPDPQLGWLIDYNDIKKNCQPVLAVLDHAVLNEIEGLENPTTENLCIWLFEKIKPQLDFLVRVTISEVPGSECSYPV